MFKKIAVLTTRSSWFTPYAKNLVTTIKREHAVPCRLFFDHRAISSGYSVVFILSYGKIIEKQFLERHRHNIVVHASNLPKGTGWAPLFWQILEGKNKIPFVLFEATEKADSGLIYLKSDLSLRGDELHDELRQLEACKVIDLCRMFIRRYSRLKPKKQTGRRTYYPRRSPKDSELDTHLSLQKLFPLLRTVSNKEFPAFFYRHGHKYVFHIHKATEESHAK